MVRLLNVTVAEPRIDCATAPFRITWLFPALKTPVPSVTQLPNTVIVFEFPVNEPPVLIAISPASND